MKGLTQAIAGIAVLAGVGGIMALTNPSQATYEDYATQRLTQYLQDNVCAKAPKVLGNTLQQQCLTFLAARQAEIRLLIVEGSQRQDLGLFSLYRTNLSITSLLPFIPPTAFPSYYAETVGIFQSFVTYKAEGR